MMWIIMFGGFFALAYLALLEWDEAHRHESEGPMSCSCKIGGGPDGVCPECMSRELFHARLKKLEDKAANDRAQGVAEERARVVAWLRSEKVIEWENYVADAIERGEHEEVK